MENRKGTGPPKWVDQLVNRFYDPKWVESILGDIQERFYFNLENKGARKAKFFYFLDAVGFMRHSRFRKKKNSYKNLNQITMVKNYIKIATRNLVKDKFNSLINIFGLGLGIACCLLCYLHISYELSYDRFHSNSDRIYRLISGNIKDADSYVKVSPPIGPTLKTNYPEVEEYVRIGRSTFSAKALITYKGDTYYEENFMLADPSLFKVFDFEILKGNKLLEDPNSIVISESIARKYFGNEEPIGKTITFDNQYDFQVSGVFADLPANTHIDLELIAPFVNIEKLFGEGSLDHWGQFNYFAYVMIQPNTNIIDLQSKIQQYSVTLSEEFQFTFDFLNLQPLSDIHFQYNRGNRKSTYDKIYLYIFSTIAIAVLLIASINFINLSIAKSTKRIQEVGLRKAFGALKPQITFQFISESIMVSCISLVVGIVLISLFLDRLNLMMGSKIMLDFLDYRLLTVALGTMLVIGILSGSYVAFYVSSFTPAKILKGEFQKSSKGDGVRKALLLFQFMISVFMVISSFTVYKQLNFLSEQKLGLNKERVITIPILSKDISDRIPTLKSEFEKSSLVSSVSASTFIPGEIDWHQTVWWEGQDEDWEDKLMFIMTADKDFIKTMEMKLVEGSMETIGNLSEGEFVYLINESALKKIGWESAVNKQLSPFGDNRKGIVAGVVADFNFKSLHHGVDPAVIAIGLNYGHSQLMIRTNGDSPAEVITFLEGKFKEVVPGIPFEFGFLDQDFDNLYKSEQRAGKIVSYLTLVSVVIALLGLYGLISFVIKDRTKEIAIRKVLGSPSILLHMQLGKEFFVILAIGILIASPLAWVTLNSWLENFTYKIDLGLPIFLLASFIMLLLVILTVGFKAQMAIQADPVKSLKHE